MGDDKILPGNVQQLTTDPGNAWNDRMDGPVPRTSNVANEWLAGGPHDPRQEAPAEPGAQNPRCARCLDASVTPSKMLEVGGPNGDPFVKQGGVCLRWWYCPACGYTEFRSNPVANTSSPSPDVGGLTPERVAEIVAALDRGWMVSDAINPDELRALLAVWRAARAWAEYSEAADDPDSYRRWVQCWDALAAAVGVPFKEVSR